MLFPRERYQHEERVVVTGAGIVTALGFGWRANADGFRSGRSAFRPVTLFDVSRQRVKTAAEVTLPADMPFAAGGARQRKRLDRAAQLLLWAADEAWRQSGWESGGTMPIVLGTTSGGMSLGEAYYRQALAAPGPSRKQAERVTHYQAQQQSLDLANTFGFEGPVTIIANACASGGNALGHAWHLVRSGSADRVFAGGYDAISQLVFSGFDSLQALSPTSCRPFDASRDGLALGEGAAMFTIESLTFARKRGADILAEIAGYGAATDVHHLTQPHPEGNAAVVAMRSACESGRVTPSQVAYVNAHGTGTPLNDAAEAVAIGTWAESHVRDLSVTSTKASIGHLLGAAGAVEALACMMALREGWIPPMPATGALDAACHFHVPKEPIDRQFDYALSNSFGFGGANASLLFRRWA